MKVLVAGELNADLIFSGFDSLPHPGREVLASDFSMVLGSSSAICAAGLSRLGTDVSFLSKVGEDHWGEFCISELRRMDVDTALVQVAPGVKTGITGSFTFKDRALVTYLGAIAELTAADIPADVLSRFRHLHVSSYYLQRGLRPGLAGLFEKARALGLTVSLDPGHDPAERWDLTGLADALRHCDVFLLNEVELAGLTGRNDLEDGLRALANGHTTIVAKLGERGCAAKEPGGGLRTAAAIAVDCVDTTGAGDSFNAGFLHAWLRGFTLDACLECGTICGGLSTRRLGGCAGQARWQEVEERMEGRLTVTAKQGGYA